ncbi:MAG: SprT family zinc-dependent metalloprotease [Bacilli bacterium]|nr:SprT family zinc-dependent metalloprotease [Bacilli bacterium]
MEIDLLNKTYKVDVIKKNNKNTYIRVKPDFTILVTTGPYVSKKEIYDLLKKHEEFLIKNITKRELQLEKSLQFYYLGKKYDIIIFPPSNKVEIDSNKIYTPSKSKLEKWYKKQISEVLNKHLLYNYQKFSEKIILPKLRIRKMKTRWGVCNIKDGVITLNSELIKYEIEVINYVIIHELAHLIEPNHSKDFWVIVEKHCPNYKKIRKYMRE